MGSARGRFEGNTLVVETTNFTDKTGIGVNGGGVPNSEQLKLTERFTRVDPAMIEYVATVDDPGAFTAPWTMRRHDHVAARLRGARVLVPRG